MIERETALTGGWGKSSFTVSMERYQTSGNPEVYVVVVKEDSRRRVRLLQTTNPTINALIALSDYKAMVTKYSREGYEAEEKVHGIL